MKAKKTNVKKAQGKLVLWLGQQRKWTFPTGISARQHFKWAYWHTATPQHFFVFLNVIFHHTDLHLEEFSCAGSWWWVSWWRPCPGWSWRCGAGAAPEPAGKTPPTPSRGDIAPHLSTSPFSALNSPCERQTRGQPLRGHWVDSLPRHTGEAASPRRRVFTEADQLLSTVAAKCHPTPKSDTFTSMDACRRVIGRRLKEMWPPHGSDWLAGEAWIAGAQPNWSAKQIMVTFMHPAHQTHRGGAW